MINFVLRLSLLFANEMKIVIFFHHQQYYYIQTKVVRSIKWGSFLTQLIDIKHFFESYNKI